jgi:predicted transposase/invertase (TIGR01784 family)
VRSSLDPTDDFVFKLLFEAPEARDILAALLTAVLHPTSPIAVVDVLNPGIPPDVVQDKSIVLDLHVVLADGRRLDVEMQTTPHRAFRARALYYWSKLFSAQLERGAPYTLLVPAISVLLLDYLERPSGEFHSIYSLQERHSHEPYGDHLELHLIELPRAPQARQEDTLLVSWARFFTATSDEEVEALAMNDPAIARAKARLDTLSADEAVSETVRLRRLARVSERLEAAAVQAEMDAAKAQLDAAKAAREQAEAARDQAEAAREKSEAAREKSEAALEQAEAARAQAEAELRRGIFEFAEAFGLPVTEERRAELERCTLDELVALRQRLYRERRW